MAYRNYSVANGFIVDKSGNGDFTTIAAALTAAVSGDTIFIRPGTYTENPTLKAGVNLTAFNCDGFGLQSVGVTPHVEINGMCGLSSGAVVLSGLTFGNSSNYCLSVSGSLDASLLITNCTIIGAGHNAINFTNSDSDSQIYIQYSTTSVTPTFTLYDMTATGTLSFYYTSQTQSGTAVSNNSAGTVIQEYSNGNTVSSTSSTGSIAYIHCDMIASTNVTLLTTAGTGTSSARYTHFSSGTSSALSIGSGTTLNAYHCDITSSNTNAIAGTGTLNYQSLTFSGTSSQLNSGLTLSLKGATPSNAASGFVWTSTGTNTSPTWQAGGTGTFSVNIQTFASSGTYTPTSGMLYCIIECVGGGGGGGGSASATATLFISAGGGGGGAYSRKFASAATIGVSQTVTVGAAGAAGTAGNNNGGAGGQSSIGSICTANGGTGGTGNGGSASPAGGAGGVAGTGDFSVPGQAGIYGSATTVITGSGTGGSSVFGFGGGYNLSTSPLAGTAGQVYGGGGSGGTSFNVGGTSAGGAGAKGIVIVTEYI